MALFGFGKEKKGEGSADLVLAYVEDAQRVRTSFRLADERGRETTAQLIGLSPENGLATFQVQGPLPGEKGSRIQATFILDGLRIGGTCLVVSTRVGQADLSLPSELAILERRKKPRAKLNPREGATLTALSGLFEGTGLTGIIENLSEIGARVKIERAMEVKGERKLSLHTSLVNSGHAFGLLRLSKLPRMSGAWECSGHAVYLEGGSAALFLGVAFSSFPSEALGALRSVISSRVNAQPSSLPPKARRNQEPDPDTVRASTPKVEEPVAVQTAKGPEVLPPQASAESAPPSSAQGTPVAEPGAVLRNSALLRLKKRSRTLVVVAPPANAHRYLLVDHLNEEGYGKVLVAQTLRELLAILEEAQPSLLLVEDGVAELQGIDLVEALHRVHDDLPPLVLALEEISTATVLAAKRAGVTNLMVKPYELDDAFSAILEGALGL
jgi:CheY-like chemotaxis protein